MKGHFCELIRRKTVETRFCNFRRPKLWTMTKTNENDGTRDVHTCINETADPKLCR